MLDPVFRRHADAYLALVALRLVSLRVRANALTLASFVCGAVAVLDIAHRNYLFGLGCLVAARVLDMLDGPVARQQGPTAFGAYLDRVLDLLVTAAVPFAFALAQPEHALAAMFLLLGLVARAAATTSSVPPVPAGLSIGKSELFVAFALACIFPYWFSVVAYAIGILCFVAAGSRVAAVRFAQP